MEYTFEKYQLCKMLKTTLQHLLFLSGLFTFGIGILLNVEAEYIVAKFT